jgi:hypothetical protein
VVDTISTTKLLGRIDGGNESACGIVDFIDTVGTVRRDVQVIREGERGGHLVGTHWK